MVGGGRHVCNIKKGWEYQREWGQGKQNALEVKEDYKLYKYRVLLYESPKKIIFKAYNSKKHMFAHISFIKEKLKKIHATET